MAENTELVMTLKLKDELTALLKKAEKGLNDLDKQTKTSQKVSEQVNTSWKKSTDQVSKLNKAMIALGVTSLANGFALNMLVTASENLAKVTAQTQFAVSLLGPEAQKAYDAMKPNFAAIGESVMATASQVNEAYGIMSAASGLATLSVEDLQGAFNLARVTGISFQEAANLIGEALRGNQDPLRQLVGPYGYTGLEDVLKKAGLAASNSWTAFDKARIGLMSIRDDLANKLLPILNLLIGLWNSLPQPMQESIVTFAAVAVAIAGITVAAWAAVAAFTALDVAAPYILGIGAAIAGVIVIIQNWGAIWRWLEDNITSVINNIRSIFGPLPALIIGGIFAIIEVIQHWGNMWDWLSGIAASVLNGILGNVNAVISGLNSLIGLINHIPGVSIPNIPTIGGGGNSNPYPYQPPSGYYPPTGPGDYETMASGGIVTRPTHALIGESGPEAVVPLSGSGLENQSIIINLYATTADRNALADFARQLTPYLQQNNRRGPAGAAIY